MVRKMLAIWLAMLMACAESFAQTTPTPNIGLQTIVPGSLIGTWGPVVNNNFSIIDSYLGGTFPNNFSALNNNLFAEKFPGVDNSCRISNAIAALPASPTNNGGWIYAQNLPIETGGGSCNIDPGTKVVTLFLPAGTLFVNQIFLRPSFHIYGMGSGGFTQQSIVQSCATCGSTDVFVLGGSTAVSGVKLAGFRVYGQSGASGSASQSAFNITAQTNGGGLWWSDFTDLNILGFCGAGSTHGILRFDGSAAGVPPGINQFDTFSRIEAYRPSGCGPDIEIHGFNGQMKFVDSHYDSQPGVTTGTNILISDVSSSLFPFNMIFDNVTTQGGDVGINTQGCNQCTFFQTHMEALHGAWKVDAGTGATTQVFIFGSQLNNNVGVNSGSGYLVDLTAPSTNASVVFGPANNFGSPDNLFLGNIAGIQRFGNFGGTTVGGTQFNNDNGFPYTTINTGILPNGSGYKHFRTTAGCTTGASVGATCDTTVTWASPFLDSNYTPQCGGFGISSGVPVEGGVVSKLAASLVFRTVAGTSSAAQFTDIACSAVHD